MTAVQPPVPRFTSRQGVAVDAGGNFYISDGNNRIRKVSNTGIITTVAGAGLAGYSGDGARADDALLYHPIGVAVDTSGNLYIADTYNEAARKVSSAGIIKTVAGIAPGTVASAFGDGVPATSAWLITSSGVAVDAAGNLYIADYGTDRIRKVSTTGIITTVAGVSGEQGYTADGPATNPIDAPVSVATDNGGNLYLADDSSLVRRISTNGIITTVAGTGSAGYSGDGGSATGAMLTIPGTRRLIPLGMCTSPTPGTTASARCPLWEYLHDRGYRHVRILRRRRSRYRCATQ